MPEQGNLGSDIASAAIMTRQARLLAPILLFLTAISAVCILTDFGGFSRTLLLSALSQHVVFTAVIIFAFVLVLRRGVPELAVITAATATAVVAQSTGVLGVRTAPIAVGASCLVVILPLLGRGEVYGIARFFFVICSSLVLPVASTLALIGQQLTVLHSSTYDVPAYLADHAYGFLRAPFSAGCCGPALEPTGFSNAFTGGCPQQSRSVMC